MAPTERDYMLRVRMSEDERAMLTELADAEGLTASDAVRQLIRRAHADRGPVLSEQPTKKPKRKR
jgi:hypothetical protein